MRELTEQIQLENSLQTPKSFKQKAAGGEGGCKSGQSQASEEAKGVTRRDKQGGNGCVL